MNLALILGCARSGTSILGELIGSHPEVKYRHEAHAVWSKAGFGENKSHRLTAPQATPEVTQLIRKRFKLAKGEANFFAEKCPRSVLRIPFIREVFPEAKLIHIIRDGRDVACSMLPGMGGDKWQHLRPPNWRQLLQEHHGVMRCAHAWKAIVEIALHDLAGVPHFVLKYEDLVDNPERLAGEILRFLGLAEHPDVFAFCRKIQNQTADSYQAQKQVAWFRDDHQVRVGRWQENLPAGEARQVEELLRPLLVQLGYGITPENYQDREKYCKF